MFKKKNTPYYKKYYLFGKCIWKHQKSIKQVSEYLLSEIADMCLGVKQNVDENISKTQNQINDFNIKTKQHLSMLDTKINQLNNDLQSLHSKSCDEFLKLQTSIKSVSDENKTKIDVFEKNIIEFDNKINQKISEQLKAENDKLEHIYAETQRDILKISSKTDVLDSKIQSEFDTIKSEIKTVDNKKILSEQSVILQYLQQQVNSQMNKIHYLNAVAIKNEVTSQGYVIDKNWAKSFVRYKIANYELKQLQLKDLYIDDWQDKNMGTPVKIKDSPNYKYLSGNKEDYIKRCYNEPSHSCEAFDNLIKNLEEKGMNFANIISVDQNNHIIDGAHRASWLTYKYGEDYNITVLKVYFEN